MRMILAALVLATLGSAASAAPKQKSLFLMDRVLLSEGVPDSLEPVVRKQIAKLVAERPELLAEMPADAPDPDKEPAAFEAYLKKRNLRAYRVRVEFTRYKSQEEKKDGKHWLWVDIGLRLFGETVPGASFGFTGDGAATVKVEVGPQVRARDQEYAQSEALVEALGKAMNTAVGELKKPSPVGAARGSAKQKKPAARSAPR